MELFDGLRLYFFFVEVDMAYSAPQVRSLRENYEHPYRSMVSGFVVVDRRGIACNHVVTTP